MSLQRRINGGDTAGLVAQDAPTFASAPAITAAGSSPPPPPPVAEPSVAAHADLKERVHQACIAKLGPQLFAGDASSDLNTRVDEAIDEELDREGTELSREERDRILGEIRDDILGYGPIEPLLRDDSVSEMMVNSADRIYVERSAGSSASACGSRTTHMSSA